MGAEVSTSFVRPFAAGLLSGAMATAAAGVPGASIDQLVAAALTDASKVTGLTRGSLKVLESSAVDWPDGAMGCPEPGVGYTQAIVPGWRIRIQAGEQVLNYHAARSSTAPVLCSAKRVQPALPSRDGIE